MNVKEVLPKDAIASIDTPAFGAEYFGTPDDEVIVVDVEGSPPRAYPIRILSHHEIVNDEIDGRPIAVTWCPICWSAVVYDRTVDGQPLTFGVSGKLADDALVMYDRETDTEWKQPTGEAIAGEHEGRQLEAMAAPILTWERFTADYPDGVVLQPARGPSPEAGVDAAAMRDVYDMEPYERYVADEAFGLYGMRGSGEPRAWDRSDLDAKTLVLGIEHGGAAVGYPLPRVMAADGVVTDTVGELDVIVTATGGRMAAFENPGFDIEVRDGIIHADGTTWDSVSGESADGRELTRVPARRLFAFAWQDAHGPSAFYQ
ncbi:MAG: DUF3179 domain-containing protein [Halobacteriales archaeon]|nr:DUF3179 domain-containing protein [Halobacteriales archaeon]